MEEVQHQRLQEAAEELARLPEWGELTQEEHSSVLGDLETLTLSATPDLQGPQTLLNQDFGYPSKAGQLGVGQVR